MKPFDIIAGTIRQRQRMTKGGDRREEGRILENLIKSGTERIRRQKETDRGLR